MAKIAFVMHDFKDKEWIFEFFKPLWDKTSIRWGSRSLELLKMSSFSLKTGHRLLQNICAHLPRHLLTVALGAGFHAVDE